MTQRLSRPLWLLLWDGEEKEEIFFSFREGEPVWRRRERLARERQLAEPKGQDGSKDRTDSFLSCVPGPPPVSFLQIGFIECNILIKNTHTFPFGCIKRFLTKHCNVAINPLPPEPSQVITQLWHFAFNVYFDGYVPARVGAQGEEEWGGGRGDQSALPPLLAIPCVFLIKAPQTGEPTLGKGGGLVTHYQSCCALALGVAVVRCWPGLPIWVPQRVPGMSHLPMSCVLFEMPLSTLPTSF